MALIPIYTWNKNVLRFSRRNESISNKPWFQGVLLLVCVAVAMLLANLSVTKDTYFGILESQFSLHYINPNGSDLTFPEGMTVEKFINDILMTVFFFSVGLEIKREVMHGQLSSVKKAILPIIAAFGGVAAPAIIFTVVNHGTAAATGWGIPTATDIAFAVCILTVLGDRVPVSLKVFLTALAIADDLIAILVVALFYGGHIRISLLLAALGVIALTMILQRIGEKRGSIYILLAILLWILFYYAGIHATMSGVVMAFLIPSKPRYSKSYFYHKWDTYCAKFRQYDPDNNSEDVKAFPTDPQRHYLRELGALSSGTMDMSYKVERLLSPWVNFLIMPLFAIANAGVEIDTSYLNVFTFDPHMGSVSMGIFLGLLVGKPLGITLLSWISIKLKIGVMPDKATWPMFFAVACLGGIGFTMSIFVDTLSFADQAPEVMSALRSAGKVAVLMGSVCAGILGTILISIVSKFSKK